MKEHIVTCVSCGKRFDANFGAHYIKKSRRYQCMECYRKEHPKTEQKQEKQKNPKTAIVVKVVIGAFFLLGAFACKSAGQIIAAIAIGAALIAWAVYPIIKAKRGTKDEKAQVHNPDGQAGE